MVPEPGTVRMRSIFTSFKCSTSQPATDFRQLRQYCLCTDSSCTHSNSEKRTITPAEDRKVFIFAAVNNLEPYAQVHSLIANKRLPAVGSYGISQRDGREAQQADNELRQAEKQGAAGGRNPFNCSLSAVEHAKVGTAFGDEPSQDLTSMKSDGRREWNNHNDKHCPYGNFL